MNSKIRLNRPADSFFDFSKRDSPFSTFFVLLTVFSLLLPAAADTILVPTDFADIQAAIDDDGTIAGDEIVVAPGTYPIADAIDFKGKAIILRSAGGDPADTILDGQNTAFHVIQCVSGEESDTVLSGFTITGGNANGSLFPDNRGGGMFNSFSSPTVTNCIFRDNFAHFGGGMFNDYGSPTVTNGIFSGNATTLTGGGMSNYSSNPLLINCLFTGNETLYGDGGGISNDLSNPTVMNCTFSRNTAPFRGGGMDSNYGSLSVTNCIFWNNVPDQISLLESFVIISFSDIAGGLPSGSFGGGGNIDADPYFADPDGSDDTAGTDDDDLHPLPGSPCIDTGTNAIPPDIQTDLDGIVRIQNGVVDMGAYEYGDDCDNNGTPDYLQLDSDGDGYIDQCDICPGHNDHLDNDADGAPNGCDICPGFDDTADGDGDGVPDGCDICPGFDDGNDADADGVPDGCDQCPGFDDTIDADGDAIPDDCDACPDIDNSIDSDGDAIPDCFDAPGVHNRTQVTDHYVIQTALNQAADFDLIEVDPGTYAVPQTVDLLGKAVYLRSAGGDPADTILDGHDSLKHVVQCISDEGPDTILDGFTITGGNANGSGSNANGGGMYNNGAGPTVIHCVFGDNSAKTNGGAMYNGNDGNPTVLYCTFNANTAGTQGNAIFNANNSPTFAHCIFRNNTGGNYGGAIYSVGASPILIGCLFSGNATQFSGGAIAKAGGNPTIMHCSFSNNAADSGGGIANLSGSLTVTNSVFRNNAPSQISGSAVISFCNIQGGLPAGATDGGGNIDADPLFVDPDNDDYRLQPASPCIDAGDTTALPPDTFDLDDDNNTTEPIPLDLAGRIRLVDNLNTVDTGAGGPPVVDMGAYEFQGCNGNLDAVSGVHLGDVALTAGHWMETNCGYCGGADFDGDHAVGMGDLMVQADNWLCDTN